MTRSPDPEFDRNNRKGEAHINIWCSGINEHSMSSNDALTQGDTVSVQVAELQKSEADLNVRALQLEIKNFLLSKLALSLED